MSLRLYLTFQSRAVTLRTTRFNIWNLYTVLKLHLCVLYGSQNKQQLFLYRTLTGWLCITEVDSVHCAVRTETLYETDSSVFKGLKKQVPLTVGTWYHVLCSCIKIYVTNIRKFVLQLIMCKEVTCKEPQFKILMANVSYFAAVVDPS
jgi:hypothetical protein